MRKDRFSALFSQIEQQAGRVEGAIFDVDGTILDSMSIWETAGERYLREQGVQAEKNLAETMFAMTYAEAAEYMKKQYVLPLTVEEISEGIDEVVGSFYRDEAAVKPGVEALLNELFSRGIPMAVATSNSRRNVETAFERCGIRKYFQHILTCSEIGAGKSKPDIFYQASEKLGTEPGKTLVAEDSLYAIETAKKAGFITVGVYDKTSFRDRDKIILISDYYLNLDGTKGGRNACSIDNCGE